MCKWILTLGDACMKIQSKYSDNTYRCICCDGHIDMLLWLQNDMKQNKYIMSHLSVEVIKDYHMLASGNGHINICEWLIDKYDYVSDSTLIIQCFLISCKSGHF